MDPTPLVFLTYLAVILLFGILSTLLSQYLKIPNILFLILIGIGLGALGYFQFPPLFLTATSILALVMIVFDSTSRLKLKEFDLFSSKVLKLTFIFLILNIIILTFFTLIIDNGISNIWYALVFAGLISGTDPATMMVMFKNTKNKVAQFLEIESIVNTPIIVLIPFIFIDLMNSISGADILHGFISQLLPFLQQIISGIGTGILIGLIVFKIMRKFYSETLSPVAIVTAALLAYIIAENLGGNGVLAVTIMGIFYGSVYVKEKFHLLEFSTMFANSLEIIVFVLLGLIISMPFTVGFFFNSLVLFAGYLLIRALAIWISLKNSKFKWKEKLLMSLSVQKGIAVAVVVFTLSTLGIPGLEPVLDLALIFVIYSIVLSTFITRFSGPLFQEHFPPENVKKIER